MIGVLNEMVALIVQEESVDVLPDLVSENWGRRLAAFVYFYIYPSLTVLSELISSVKTSAQHPFVQLRGIEAIGKVLEGSDQPRPEVVEGIEELRLLLETVGERSVRKAELTRILSRFDSLTTE
jgi:hypothetical protein